jgi:hypothetical protein
MPRTPKLSQLEQEQAAEKKKRYAAYSAAIAAAPERWEQLQNDEWDAERICRTIDKKYTNLFRARGNAESLHHQLQEAGMIAEAVIVAGLLPMIEKQFEPILETLEKAKIELTAAKRALNNEFPAP